MRLSKQDLTYGLILIAAIVLIVGYMMWSTSGESAIPDKARFVCVASGEEFRIGPEEMPTMLPMRHPQTGEATLLPCFEKDGRLYVSRRCGRMLKDLRDVNKFVDPETLEIRNDPP
jgi:hypothetical protein